MRTVSPPTPFLRTRGYAACLMLACMLLASMTSASGPQGLPDLQPRSAAPPAEFFALAATTPVDRLVIKFHEGTHVRLRDGVLQELERSPSEEASLSELSLTPSQIADDAATVQYLLALSPKVEGLGRLFSQGEGELEGWKASGEQKSGRQLADLNLYFQGTLTPGTRFEDLAEILTNLNALASIEIAYAEPPAELATTSSEEETESGSSEKETKPGGSNTQNFEPFQGYLSPAPQGVDAVYSWTVAGGAGQSVRIVDVEYAWNTTHEDLPNLFHQGGVQFPSVDFRNHGTAVLGQMVGVNNGFGVKGIAHQAQAGYESVHQQQSTASAIAAASVAAGAGNLVLIELHRLGPANASPCGCNVRQCDFIAVEFWQAEYDAIANATANGVIVVEAAGNGSTNLDSPAYGGLFNPKVRDSGAIVVGASSSAFRSPTCWTNHGSRVDVHGWGENVVTTGYGNLQGGVEDRWYTQTFSGTSSASPIVTGAAASLQGAARADGQGNLSPAQMRRLLASTGTPQTGSLGRAIGPLPNLRAALDQLLETNEPPVANFTYSGSGLVRTFDGSSSTGDQGIVNYQWTFPGGITKTGVSVSHFFPNYGSHAVTLTVTDTAGATGTTNQLVNLAQPTITPNQGLWYNPDRSGNGISFNRNSAGNYSLFWYTYLPDGTPFWYFSDTGPKSQSTWEQPLYQTSWNPATSSASLTQVGSVKLVFSDTGTAWFSWVLNGQPGGERFAFLHGGTGRTGMWYQPPQNGWGTQIAESGTTLVALVAFYQGSEPRWVLGQTTAGGFSSMDVSWFNEPGLCPGCGGGSSAPPTGQVVGTTSLQIANGSSTTGNQWVQINIPGGGTWSRTNVPIVLLTEP